MEMNDTNGLPYISVHPKSLHLGVRLVLVK